MQVIAALSGAFRPGLIEAAIPSQARTPPPALSGAFRPGLIEANLGRFGSCAGRHVIRGISPRPH